MTQDKFISTGGVGDAFIAGLKLLEWQKSNLDICVDWLHIESCDISSAFFTMIDLLGINANRYNWNLDFCHEPNYIKDFKSGRWNDRMSVPISFSRECPLHKTIWTIEHPFLWWDTDKEYDVYDVCIQVSAGQKNNKAWDFNVITFADLLVRNYGFKVCLIGNDERFKPSVNVKTGCEQTDERIVNEVCLHGELDIASLPICDSKLFIGLSGFMNYFACATKTPNVHLIEGPEQELDYYHEKWKDLTYGIKYPTLHEVMRSINHYRMLGVL